MRFANGKNSVIPGAIRHEMLRRGPGTQQTGLCAKRDTPLRAALMITLALSILVADTAHAASAQTKQPTVANGPVSVYFGDYKPVEPKSLDEIPDQIRRKLQAHLIDRLGEKYVARLTFVGGQIVDHDELYRVDPAANYQWTVFAYSLIFRMSAPEKGITAYYARIELDKNGDVIQDIELPPVRRLPLKQDVIPLSHAYASASQHKFDRNKLRPEIAYNRDIESIVYQLSEVIGLQPQTDRVIEIDAHSGRVLHIRKAHWSH